MIATGVSGLSQSSQPTGWRIVSEASEQGSARPTRFNRVHALARGDPAGVWRRAKRPDRRQLQLARIHGASQLQLEFRDRVRLELGFELQITHRVP